MGSENPKEPQLAPSNLASSLPVFDLLAGERRNSSASGRRRHIMKNSREHAQQATASESLIRLGLAAAIRLAMALTSGMAKEQSLAWL